MVPVAGPARVSGCGTSTSDVPAHDPEETVTEPYDPEETPTPTSSSGSGEWSTSPADPPTEPGWARSEAPPTPSDEPSAGPSSASSAEPVGPPRRSWWRSPRVRAGAVGTLAALVLLGGGFGAGYAVADASAPATTPAATHAAATAKGHPRKGAAGARKRQQQAQQGQQGAGPTI